MPGSGDAAFKQALRNVRDDKIKPILEEARTSFIDRGVRSEIVTSGDLSIALILRPETRVRAELEYRAMVKKRLVHAAYVAGPLLRPGDTAPVAGTHSLGKYSLEDLTPELVESHVNDLRQAFEAELQKVSGRR